MWITYSNIYAVIQGTWKFMLFVCAQIKTPLLQGLSPVSVQPRVGWDEGVGGRSKREDTYVHL